MPNIKSAKKRVKVTRARTLKNKMLRSELKTAIKKYYAAYVAAVKKVDQASARGIIHKNKAARKKSQFTKTLNSLG